MRTMTWGLAALVVAFTMACEDRGRQDAADRIENAGDEAGEEIRQGADDVGDAAGDAADEVGEAAEDAADEVGVTSYERRDEFRRDVRERLDRLDRELAGLERGINEDASEAHAKAVAEARDARTTVGRNFERLTDATAANWNELRDELRESLGSLERQLRALRPDANPMGGAGAN